MGLQGLKLQATAGSEVLRLPTRRVFGEKPWYWRETGKGPRRQSLITPAALSAMFARLPRESLEDRKTLPYLSQNSLFDVYVGPLNILRI